MRGLWCGIATMAVSAGGSAADPPEDGKGPEIRSERVEQAKEAEERAQVEKDVEFNWETARIDDLHPDWEFYEIREVISDQQAAWNRGDIDAFMAGYWKSDDLRFASGNTVTNGWQATLERYKKRYASREKMGTLKFSNVDIDVLSEDTALVFGRFTLERKDGMSTGLFTLLFRKIDDNWVIVHDHTSSE